MEQDELEVAAKRAGLEKLFAQFPEEVAVAAKLAAEQCATLLAMPFDADDAP